MTHKELKTFSDGGARGNPGPAAIGVVIMNLNDEILQTHGSCIGNTTNNQAEYKALLKALELAKELGAETVDCYLDSELVVKQLRQEYRVRDAALAPLFIKAWNQVQGFKKVRFHHVRRELNVQADALVNDALDGKC